MAKKKLSLTKIRRATLQALAQGSLMEIDSFNMASIDGQPVAPVNRYFLTDHRLVTRKDKSKSVTTKGNGYVITDKGRRLIDDLS